MLLLWPIEFHGLPYYDKSTVKLHVWLELAPSTENNRIQNNYSNYNIYRNERVAHRCL